MDGWIYGALSEMDGWSGGIDGWFEWGNDGCRWVDGRTDGQTDR